jgi:mono/diheme cytochrome c family protein
VLGGMAACSSESSPVGAPNSAAAPNPATVETSHSAMPVATDDVGRRIYDGNCIACHQQNARGIPGVYPSLVGSAVVLGDPKAFALWVVKGQRVDSMPAAKYPTVMPQYGWMKTHDVAVLQTYLRSNFGNAAPPVDATALAAAMGD